MLGTEEMPFDDIDDDDPVFISIGLVVVSRERAAA
jgi:hypothetical protein